MLLYSSVLYAQFGTSERSILSLQTGPTFYTGKLIGVAGHSSSLRNGIGWSGSYTYLIGNKPAIRVGFGVLYQGSRYTNDMPNSSDKIQTHYFAPQFGSVVILGGLIFVTSIYAYTFASLKRKNLISTTPLNDALNALILALNASAAAFVLLFTKKFKILS